MLGVQKVGSEFQVNTYTTSNQQYPSVTHLNNGGFVVIWASNSQDGSSYGVYGQKYDSRGNKAGAEFLINTYTQGNQDHPSVTGLNDGGFVVTWHSIAQDDPYYGVYGQIYDNIGNKLGNEFRINTYTTYANYHSSVAGLNTEGFVVVWVSDDQRGASFEIEIHGKMYDANGNKIGNEFQIGPSSQFQPSAAGLTNGGFVVTWNRHSQNSEEIYGQIYPYA